MALWAAARSWLASGGTVPIERCARLPATPGALRNATRDFWLRRAAELVEPGKPAFTQAHPVARELDSFLSRGMWRAWQEFPTPPANASQLSAALFRVAKFNGGESLSARHIARIIANK